MPIPKIPMNVADQILDLLDKIYSTAGISKPEILEDRDLVCLPLSADDNDIDDHDANEIYAAILSLLLQYANRELLDYKQLDDLLGVFFTIDNNVNRQLQDMLAAKNLSGKDTLTIAGEFYSIVEATKHDRPNIKMLHEALALHVFANQQCLNMLRQGTSGTALNLLLVIAPLQPKLRLPTISQLIEIVNINQHIGSTSLIRDSKIALESVMLSSLVDLTINWNMRETIEFLDILYAAYNPLSFEKVLFRAAIDSLLKYDDPAMHIILKQRYGCSLAMTSVKGMHFYDMAKNQAMTVYEEMPSLAEVGQNVAQRVRAKFE